MKLLQINTTVNSGSTGRITELVGEVAIKHDHDSYIAFGRGDRPSSSKLIRIGNKVDLALHGLLTLVFDRHGFGSVRATKKLLKRIEELSPDGIGLHNLHGYYINIELLFDFLSAKGTPVVWTLFDAWSFTGHCSYFDDVRCDKWISGCFSCEKKKRYPSSYLLDNSKDNYIRKKEIFSNHPKLAVVVNSHWLGSLVKRSFLRNYPLHVIASGVDVDVFKPTLSNVRRKYKLADKNIILGCANIWDRRKGLQDFLNLASMLPPDQEILLVGLTKKQIGSLPKNIRGIARTESLKELVEIYSVANVFVNPTWQDNFPTTNLEALACGTPVITYNTGGSPEAIDDDTGFVVDKGNIAGLFEATQIVMSRGKAYYENVCRERAIRYFNKDDRYREYLALFEQLTGDNKI